MPNPTKPRSVCVFLSSSDAVDASYFKVAEETGRLIAERQWTLVYGGSNIGLMGELARAAHKNGGDVVGIIPNMLHKKVPVLDVKHELVVTKDLRQRKTEMELRSDAFIALPGGFGTLEELLEIITLKQLKHHNKPIVILNSNGFYDPLIHFFDHMFDQKFIQHKHRELYFVAKTAGAALDHIVNLLK